MGPARVSPLMSNSRRWAAVEQRHRTIKIPPHWLQWCQCSLQCIKLGNFVGICRNFVSLWRGDICSLNPWKAPTSTTSLLRPTWAKLLVQTWVYLLYLYPTFFIKSLKVVDPLWQIRPRKLRWDAACTGTTDPDPVPGLILPCTASNHTFSWIQIKSISSCRVEVKCVH